MALIICEECKKEISIVSVILLGYYLYTNFTLEEQKSAENVVKAVVNQPIVVFDEEVQIGEDQYIYLPADLDKASYITLEYNVKSGPKIDVYVVEDTQLRHYKNNDSIQYIESLSTFGSSTSSRTAYLEKGKYIIIFDNTDYGKTYPPMNLADDIATIDIKISMK
jgi:hypothetical protein